MRCQGRGNLGAGRAASGVGREQSFDGDAGTLDQRQAVLRCPEDLVGQSALGRVDGAQDGEFAVLQLAVALRFLFADRLLELLYLRPASLSGCVLE